MLPIESKVSFRLTPAQLGTIRPGRNELGGGYHGWHKTNRYPDERLLYIHLSGGGEGSCLIRPLLKSVYYRKQTTTITLITTV